MGDEGQTCGWIVWWRDAEPHQRTPDGGNAPPTPQPPARAESPRQQARASRTPERGDRRRRRRRRPLRRCPEDEHQSDPGARTAADERLRSLRNVDTVFRVGPFRFAALLPETPADGAAAAARRVETRIPDVTVGYAFPLALRIHALGWADDAPPIDDALADIVPQDAA
jgi:hypothetical protein